jgi:Zn-dependent protease with chaperone function
MIASRRSLALGGVALATSGLWPPLAAAAGDQFSISGKKGPFLKQVGGRKIAASRSQGGSLGLASDAINQGQYQQARLRMPKTEAAVRALIDRLLAQWPYPKGPPPQVFILGVNYYNAYSLPDNSVVIAFGLLDRAQSDDEVAFVLGHELSHLLLGHFAANAEAARKRQDSASRLGQLYLVSSVLGSAADTVGGGVGAAASAARQAGATSDSLHFLTDVTAEPIHTRVQEDEADALGFDLSQAAAYAAEDASALVFDTIQADQVQRKLEEDGLQSQLKSQLSQAVTRNTAQSFLSGGLAAADVRHGLLTGGMAALSAGGGSRAPEPAHRPPVERKRGIAQYSVDAYPAGAPLRDEQKTWLGRLRATTEFAQARVAVVAVQEAMKARGLADYPTATAAMARASATAYRSAPMVVCEAARLREDMGDIAGADRLFTQADTSPDQTVDGCLDHARLLYRAAEYDRALQVIDAGVTRFGDEKPFLSLIIAVSRQNGRQNQVDLYLQRCADFNDANLKQDCELAAGKKVEKPKADRPNIPFGIPSFPHL